MMSQFHGNACKTSETNPIKVLMMCKGLLLTQIKPETQSTKILSNQIQRRTPSDSEEEKK